MQKSILLTPMLAQAVLAVLAMPAGIAQADGVRIQPGGRYGDAAPARRDGAAGIADDVALNPQPLPPKAPDSGLAQPMQDASVVRDKRGTEAGIIIVSGTASDRVPIVLRPVIDVEAVERAASPASPR